VPPSLVISILWLEQREDHYSKMASKGKMQHLPNLGLSFAFWDQEQVALATSSDLWLLIFAVCRKFSLTGRFDAMLATSLPSVNRLTCQIVCA